jgi:hypothetical protein
MGNPLNYFNYFTEIEDHFVRRRGKHILLSPLDWTLIETWLQMGIPLHVALRGIDRAMDLFAAKQLRHRFVNTLFFCNQAVMEEHEAHLASLEGAGGYFSPAESAAAPAPAAEPPAARAGLRQFLDRRRTEMERLGQRHPGTAVAEAAERVSVRLDVLRQELAAGARIDPERLEADLAGMDEVLLPALEAAISKAELDSLRSACQEELRHHRRNLGKEMYARILRNFLKKKIKDRFEISDLSLLDLPWS